MNVTKRHSNRCLTCQQFIKVGTKYCDAVCEDHYAETHTYTSYEPGDVERPILDAYGMGEPSRLMEITACVVLFIITLILGLALGELFIHLYNGVSSVK